VTLVSREPFGTTADGQAAEQITLENARGMRVSMLTYGGIVRSLVVPDANGAGTDVILGFDSLADYERDGMYVGALIGRYANRIAGASFAIDGTLYRLPHNDGKNQLHGGPCGFNRRMWRPAIVNGAAGTSLELTRRSAAGEEGFPGAVDVRVTYSLSDDDELIIAYRAECDAPTHVNLTSHMYFNLGGHDAGDVLDHELTLSASRFTPIDTALIPTGELREVAGTPFDFTAGRRTGDARPADDEQLRLGGGYDHNFVIDAGSANSFSARVRDPRSGRWLEVRTTEPGVQLYLGQGLNTEGKNECHYGAHAGLALETQHFPDSPNHPAFPTTLLRPGELFSSRTAYRFGKDEHVA